MAAPAFDVTFPLNAVGRLPGITRVVLRQAEYAHEMLLVETSGHSVADLRTNSPVQATLSAPGQSMDFVGYVHHVRDSVANEPSDRSQRVVCVGPTWRMRQQRQRVWQDMTSSEIVLAILGEYQLTGDVQPTDARYSHRVQTESDWAFICTLAKELGFVVLARQTVVIFGSRKASEEQQAATAPIFTYGVGTDVVEFVPLLGEDMPHAEGRKAARAVVGVDPRTVQVVRGGHDGQPSSTRRTDNPEALFVEADTRTVAHSTAEAALLARGATGHGLWQHRATTETRGETSVTPASFVYMADLPNHYAGFWAVIAVDHCFTGQFYRLHMTLGTDSLGRNVGNYRPPSRPFARGQQVPTQRPKPTTSTLSVPGNFDTLALRKTAGGPAPLAWRGSAATPGVLSLGKTKGEDPATLVARTRRYRNSGR